MLKIGVLGTGMVGRTIGSKLISLGHAVMLGSRTADNEKALQWVQESGSGAQNGTFADAAAFGSIIFNCTKGVVTLDVLQMAGANNLAHKTLIDVSNPLDSSGGVPPVLSVCNDNSLGEQIQTAFPETYVVKALNTMNCKVMVEPSLIQDGDHTVFICGNHAQAKAETIQILESFGWQKANILDLGDISNAKGPEMLLPLWIRLMPIMGSPSFQFKVVR